MRLECLTLWALSSRPKAAAAHVLRVCRSGSDQKDELLGLVSDWTYIVESITEHGNPPQAPDDTTRARIIRRDGARCCITGKAASFTDPLVILPVLPIPSRWVGADPRISEMLRAFFGPPYWNWWLSYAQRPDRLTHYRTHWLVRKSAAKAFARGVLTLDRRQSSMIEFKINPCLIGTLEDMIDMVGSFALLGDRSRSGIPSVDARFVGTHARLAPSIRWLAVRDQIARDEKSPSPQLISSQAGTGPSQLGHFFQTICLRAWLIVPSKARVAGYKMLRRIGQYVYGGSSSLSAQRLPFGLYLKWGRSSGALRNEANALNMVRQYTSIPVPRPIDLVSVPVTRPDPSQAEETYLLTSRLPGVPLSEAMTMLSDRDAREYVISMRDFLFQLRAIPKTVSPEYTICNTLGEACTDPRIRDGNPVGPFKDEAAFSELLRYADDPARTGHGSVFTHADLNLRNVLVDRVARGDGTIGWQVVGIVDWETSGFFPEYWECTKALFEGWRWEYRWPDLIYETFKPLGDFSRELEIEEKSWSEGDGA